MTTNPNNLDGLPKQFISAMRTLFDIMDDKRTGFVSLSDLENRWHEDNTKGVIESLRTVTPPNGLLSFERFCAGLKICLMRNQVERRGTIAKQPLDIEFKHNRPPSAPLLDIDSPNKQNWSNAVAIRPNNVTCQQRTLSMPQLLPERKDNHVELTDNGLQFEKPTTNLSKTAMYGPPKPPRTAIGIERGMPIGSIDKAEIRNALQNWQIGLMMNDHDKISEKRPIPSPQYNSNVIRTGRSLGDGKPSVQAENQIKHPPQPQNPSNYQKKTTVRRREPRRHTLQNGIDYNMLKRMKQIEQEKEVLMQGLNAVEKAREWYLKQVAAVQEKMKYLGRMGNVDNWSEAQQERLELRRARVLEVNRHLATLTESWERGGLPLHMNLAVHHHPQPLLPSRDLADRLKQQNILLNELKDKIKDRRASVKLDNLR